MKIKICGLMEREQVQAAVLAGADFIGFVFAPSRRQISVSQAKQLAKYVPSSVKKVGLFVNPSKEEVETAASFVGLDYIQLHGQESPSFVEEMPLPVIKAFSIVNGKLPVNLSKYSADILLLDSPPEEFAGGSGKTFDWEKTNIDFIKNQKIMIAGGLNAANVTQAIQHFTPYGVDVSSGVETNGRKDSKKIQAFIKAVRGENYK